MDINQNNANYFFSLYTIQINEVKDIVAKYEKTRESWIVFTVITTVCMAILFFSCINPYVHGELIHISSVITIIPIIVVTYICRTKAIKDSSIYIDQLSLIYNLDERIRKMFEEYIYCKKNIPKISAKYPLFYIDIAEKIINQKN